MAASVRKCISTNVSFMTSARKRLASLLRGKHHLYFIVKNSIKTCTYVKGPGKPSLNPRCNYLDAAFHPTVSQNRLTSLNYKLTSIKRPPCLKPTQPTERNPACKPSGAQLPALPLLKQVKTSRSLSRSCNTKASCAFSTSSWQLEVLSLATQGLRHPIFHRRVVSHHPLLNGSDVVGFVHFPGAVVHRLTA